MVPCGTFYSFKNSIDRLDVIVSLFDSLCLPMLCRDMRALIGKHTMQSSSRKKNKKFKYK